MAEIKHPQGIRFPSSPHWRLGLGSGLLLILFGVSLWLIAFAKADQILPGMHIGGIELGGQSVTQAETTLADSLADFQKLTLRLDDQESSLALADLGMNIDIHQTAQKALDLGSGPKTFATAWYRLASWFSPIEMMAEISVDELIFTQTLTKWIDERTETVHDAGLVYEDDQWQVDPAVSGRTIDQEKLAQAVRGHLKHLWETPLDVSYDSIQPKIRDSDAQSLIPTASQLAQDNILLVDDQTTITLEPETLASWLEIYQQEKFALSLRLNEDKRNAYVQTLSDRLNQEPIDARVRFADDRVEVTQASKTGRVLDQEETSRLIEIAFKSPEDRTIQLPFTLKEPDVTSEKVETLGLKELIGTATTSYAGSPNNRQHNIATGAKFLNGKLIKPGAQFSVVENLGAVDQTTGYLPELVIKENETTPEYGGGLCQVSTTLFRAALNTGLKITERRNHSYRVSYYEKGVGPGLDATIYLPNPDLKFLNDTPGWILIQNSVDTQKLESTFELYGTSDGRTSEIGKPTVTDITQPPAPAYIETADLPKGTTKQIEKAHSGAKTVVTYKVVRDGQPLFDQTFRSTYKPWQARYLVGTAELPPAPPVEIPVEPQPQATATVEPSA